MNKRFFSLLALIVMICMAVTLFAGCGGSGNATSGKNEQSPQAASTQESQAGSTASAAGQNTSAGSEKGSVSALIWIPDAPETMQQIMDEFMKANPNIKVDLQLMTGSSVEENIQPKAAANNLPDLMSVNANAFAAALADEGKIIDVSDMEAWKNTIDSLQAEWTSPKGIHFGISGGLATTLIYYNKDQFEKAGIKELPKDFNEFLAVCESLKKAGFTPIMWNGGFPNMLGNGPFSYGFANNVVRVNPDWKKQMANGTLNLNTKEVADIFAKIKLFADKGYVQKGYMSTDYNQGMQLFVEGKTAMAFHGTWVSSTFMNCKGFKTGVFLPPWNEKGEKLVPVVGSETGWAIAEGPNKALAVKVLEYMNGDGFHFYQNKRQCVPPFKQTKGEVKLAPEIIDLVKQLNEYPTAGGLYFAVLPSNCVDLSHKLMQEVLLGQKTPQQAAEALDKAAKEGVKK